VQVAFHERELRLDARISEVLVKTMCLGPPDARPEADERAASLTSPPFSALDQQPSDSPTAMLAVNYQARDYGAGFRFDELRDCRVQPAHGISVSVCDQKLLIVFSDDSGQPSGGLNQTHVVTELSGQLGNGGRILNTCRPYDDLHDVLA
jgi:hypothetical protein